MVNNVDTKRPVSSKYPAAALFFFYLMVTIEIIMMASPFTAYYYVAYGPVLKFLDSHYLTRWLGAFFLPHMIFPPHPFFTIIRGLSVILFYGGILIFFLAAIPLYYRKFRRKGLVTGGLYNYIRHPQYLGWAIWGLGLLLFWPRFIILVAYVTMLFLYYFLARNEESRFAPTDYNNYRQTTGMFFPRIAGLKLDFHPFGFIKSPGLRTGLVFVLTMGASISLGFALRAFTLSQLPQMYSGNLRVVSIKQMPESKMKAIIQAALADSGINPQIDAKSTYLAYIMPQNYKMSALIAQLPDMKKQDRGRFHFMTGVFHNFLMQLQHKCCLIDSGMDNLRIIFLKVSHADGLPVPASQAFDIYTNRAPVLYADINPQTGKILAQQPLSQGSKWGNLPQAVF